MTALLPHSIVGDAFPTAVPYGHRFEPPQGGRTWFCVSTAREIKALKSRIWLHITRIKPRREAILSISRIVDD